MVLLHIRVFHTFQEQPLCRQGRPRLTAVAAGQDARDLFRLQPEQIPGILASCDRSQAGPTLPAKGLFLKCVEYPDMKENHS